jgi:hypothetical protein
VTQRTREQLSLYQGSVKLASEFRPDAAAVLYFGDCLDVGIEILPTKAMQENMSSGPGYYEGALYDVARQGRSVPAVPLVLVGVEP